MNRTFRYGLTDISRFARRVVGAGALLSGAALVAAGCSSAQPPTPRQLEQRSARRHGPAQLERDAGGHSVRFDADRDLHRLDDLPRVFVSRHQGRVGQHLGARLGGRRRRSVAPALRLHGGRVERQRVDGHPRLEPSVASDEDRDVLRRLQGEARRGGTFNVSLTCGGTSDGGTEAGTDAAEGPMRDSRTAVASMRGRSAQRSASAVRRSVSGA